MSAIEKYMAELPEELMERITELEQQLADAYRSVTIVTEKLAKAEAKLTKQDKLLDECKALLAWLADEDVEISAPAAPPVSIRPLLTKLQERER